MPHLLTVSQAGLTRASNLLAKDLDKNDVIVREIQELTKEERESKEEIKTSQVKLQEAIDRLDSRMANLQSARDKYDAIVGQLEIEAPLDNSDYGKVVEITERTLDLIDRAQDQRINLVHCLNGLEHTKEESGRQRTNPASTQWIPTCIYCKRTSHSSVDCSELKTNEERTKYMRAHNLCINCGSPRHVAAECRAGSCRNCGRQGHHTSICKNRIVPPEHRPEKEEKVEGRRKPENLETTKRHGGLKTSKVNALIADTTTNRKIGEETNAQILAGKAQLSIDPSAQSIQPEIILGCGHLFSLLGKGSVRKKTLPSGLLLISSRLGNLIAGEEDYTSSDNSTVLFRKTKDSTNEVEEQSWEEFCTFESTGIHEYTGPTSKERELENAAIWKQFEETIEKRDDGYYVKLPWRNNANTLPENKGMAIKRLHATLKALKNKPAILHKYNETIKEQLQQNVIEEVDETSPNRGEIVHYLPHQAVLTPNKETTQLRVTSADIKDELLDWSRINQLRAAKRITAIALRFIRKLLGNVREELRNRVLRSIPEIYSVSSQHQITATDNEIALRILIRNHQATHYPRYSQRLLRNLNVYQDKHGILRCKGRIGKSDASFETKMPILIIPHTALAEAIITEHHLPYHAGTNQTMGNVRSRFWIPRLRQMTRRIIPDDGRSA
ncbi:zinc knuckle [Dictyocaulus viviparus]|uniref:Zinc knuckle n=1 Tax=Dictyocaulus viviparus TaxID=29172 RepID=A0A0D8X955_DICVI|nr:zinc knuckle [Dictyocaulus viviparus]